jgi:hypothetical protein
MIALLDAAKVTAGIALGAMIATPTAHYLGKREGRQLAAVSTLESAVKDFASKGMINGQVSASDAAALCADLGLPDIERAECVSRVRKAAAEP